MLRVLTLSTLFPNAAQPALGLFVERQTLGLARREDVELEIVSPVGLPVWPLSRHRHYARRGALALEEEWRGVRVHRPRFHVWPKVGEARAATSLARALLPMLRRLRERFAFDVIDSEFFWPDGVAAVALGRELGVPVSIKARGSDISFWGGRPGVSEQIVRAAHRADGLLAVSEALKRDMVRLGLPAKRIRVHYTGVDAERFRPLDRARAKQALGVTGPLVVTVGNLIPGKGQRVAIAVAERLPEITLLIVGDGPDRAGLGALAKPLGERVRFLGSRPHDELPVLMAAADVMLLPTRSEGLANAWVESLACGTPVVTPDVGGAREVIDRPEAGRLVPADPDLMAQAVRAILADPPEQAAVRSAAAKFSWDANRDQLFEHLASLRKGQPPHRSG